MSDYDVAYRQRKRREADIIGDLQVANKIESHHRIQFRERFPGQTEQILRLIAERLQVGLHKEAAAPLTNSEVAELSQAFQSVYQVYQDL